MSKLIVGNFKMNMSLQDVAEYISYTENYNLKDKNIIICPTHIYLPYFNNGNFVLGSQDVSIYKNGAYTGDVSASQLKSCNIKYSIVGHSERRKYYNETDSIIHEKIKNCLENNITPIVCIGESKEERLMHKTEQVLRRSILDLFKGLEKEELSKIIIAYEPIWAIGTGIIPTPLEMDETSSFIKDIIKSAFKVEVRVLYGGSVSIKNIDILKNLNSIDGFLIGGASNNPEEFIKIINILEATN